MHNLLSSLLYRLIIILYGAFIVLTHDNIIATPFYAILPFVYATLFILLLGKEKWKYWRLLLDILVVAAVLYGKAPLDNTCFVFALFPLISSIAHTGSHAKYWPILILTGVLLIVVDQQVIPTHLIVAFLVWLAGVQSWYNSQTNKFLSTTVGHIDDYFTNNDGTKKPHEIYKNIIAEINSYLECGYLKNIYSYTLDANNTLWLVNSSEFMWVRTLLLDDKAIAKLKEKRYLLDKESCSRFFLVEQNDFNYVYRCEFDSNYMRLNFRKGYVVSYVLELAFGRMSTLLASEYRIAETRRKAFEETKEHIEYVSKALKAMHFVRNKLSPISSVITFYSDMDTMDAEKVKKMEERVKKEVKQAKGDMSEIIKTANFLLDKQNNPYSGADVETKNIKFLFVILSEIVQYHLGGAVEVSEEIQQFEQRMVVRVSTMQLKLLFTDIVSNIERHKSSGYAIRMDAKDDCLVVSFINDIGISQEADCNNLLRDINNSNNEGIVSRKSHGVYNIKTSASTMGVELKAEIIGEKKNKQYVLRTSFKMFEDNGNNNSNDGNKDTGD